MWKRRPSIPGNAATRALPILVLLAACATPGPVPARGVGNAATTAATFASPIEPDNRSMSTPGSPAAARAGSEEAMRAILREADFSGAALVVRDGQVVYRAAHGAADAETGADNTPDTRFKLGSIQKQMSAALILTLVDDGTIELDDSLCQGIEKCPQSLADVTYEHILTHTSGIGELSDEEGMQIRSNEDALRVIGDKERLFEPGEDWSYSTAAYSLFTATPELLTGRSLLELEQERVYEPAGMADTGLEGFEGQPEGAAVGYATAGGSASGDTVGNWSTIDDLWAWHRALLAGDPIPSDLVALMETPHVQAEYGFSYGYGVFVRDTGGRREISHRGGTDGFSSYLVRFPDDDSLIALLSNVESTDVDALRDELVAELFAATD